MMPYDENTDTRSVYVKIMERADRGVGQILAALDRAGVSQNTLVVFTNDNGGEWLSRNAPLFNRKFSLYEGGIRVPAIIRWPGHVPAGLVTAQVGITMDLSATFLAAAGVAPADAKLEGIDLVPLIAPVRSPLTHTVLARDDRRLNQRGPRRRLEAATRRHRSRHALRRQQGPRRARRRGRSNTAVVRRMHQNCCGRGRNGRRRRGKARVSEITSRSGYRVERVRP
jgi:arylsulfatase A-like enzyme